MKKLLALVSLLIVAAACGAPANKNQVAPNTAKPAETKSTPSISESEISAKEKQVWDAVEKKDYDGYAAMLASDYLEVNSGGVFDKAATLAATKKGTLSDVSFSDWKILPIDKVAVLITYAASFKGTLDGKAFPASSLRASSAWVNRDGKWLSIFHQETDIKPPPPLAADKAAGASTSSPATTAVAVVTSGTDPVANEAIVWHSLKSKDYAAFAAFLAPDAIEIEATGVFDKAGSVKNVSLIDLSKTDLSDWKTVTFDDEASLVTYLLKVPGAKPDQGRHSTLWVNRSGKWVVLFHQGSPVN